METYTTKILTQILLYVKLMNKKNKQVSAYVLDK